MNRLIIDGTKGISGNSLLGAALSLGLPWTLLMESCERLLGPDRVQLLVKEIPLEERKIIYFNTESLKGGEKMDTFLGMEALDLLSASSLEPGLKRKTRKILAALFESKARAHGVPFGEVGFRYEGMVDTLVDALGAALTLTYFGVEEIQVLGPVETGQGTVLLPHKELTIPVPMVRILLEGFPWVSGSYRGEKVTPTGAAILKAFGKVTRQRENPFVKFGYSFPVLPYEEKDCFCLGVEERSRI